MNCPNCGGSVKDNPDSEGSVGSCENCNLAVDTSLAQEQQPPAGGSAPMPPAGENIPPLRPDTGENGTGATTELPAKSAPREEWDTELQKLGLDPADYPNKESVIEAVEGAQRPELDTSRNAPEDTPPE